jgi:hypothetical protein
MRTKESGNLALASGDDFAKIWSGYMNTVAIFLTISGSTYVCMSSIREQCGFFCVRQKTPTVYGFGNVLKPHSWGGTMSPQEKPLRICYIGTYLQTTVAKLRCSL